MRAVNVGEIGAAGVAVDRLLDTLLAAVASGGVQGESFSPPAASTANCTAAATPSSTVAASTAAVLLPARFLRVVVLRAFVPVVTLLTAVEALYSAGVTLHMHGNPTAHNRFSTRGAGKLVCVGVPQFPIVVLQPEVTLVLGAVAHVVVLIREALQEFCRRYFSP